ncbi:MAG: cyclase family protein [Desulfovibrionaceae bacterium]|nr:cyclase family protein [Desulfovibrionaceae bacterium]
MQTIDLSHPVRTGMPVFPGDEPPNLRRTCFIHRDGFAQTSLSMGSHTGTHVDAAAHLFADAPGLDWLGPDNFLGWAAVVDLTALARPVIGQPDLARLADVEALDFVLLRTGWDRHWLTDRYYRDGFPVLSETAARFLSGLGLKGIGLDTPSPDSIGSKDLPAHHILFDHGLVIAENLTNLGELPPQDFLFACLPLRIADGEASPVRAVGVTL